MAIAAAVGNDFVNLTYAPYFVSPGRTASQNALAIQQAFTDFAYTASVGGKRLYLPGNSAAYPIVNCTPTFPGRLVGDDIATTLLQYPAGTGGSSGAPIHGLNLTAFQMFFSGNPGQQTVSNQVTKGDIAITGINSTSGWLKGDRLMLRGTAVAAQWPGTNSGGLKGEIVRIASVNSSTQITLWDTVEDTYPTSFTTQLVPVHGWNGCSVENLTFQNSSPGSGTAPNNDYDQAAVLLRGLWSPYVNNLKIINSDGAGLNMQNCVEFEALNVQPEDLTDNNANNQNGYGVVVGNACQDGTVLLHAKRCRHAITTFGDNGGGPRHITVRGTARQCTGTSWDTHAEGQHILFEDCQVAGSDYTQILSDDAGHGFQLRCPNVRIKGGIVDQAHGWGVYSHSTATPDLDIDGLTIHTMWPHPLENSAAGIWLQGAQSTVRNCNIIIGQASTAAYGQGGGITGVQIDADNILVENTSIRRLSGSGGCAITATASATNGIVAGNFARGGYTANAGASFVAFAGATPAGFVSNGNIVG